MVCTHTLRFRDYRDQFNCYHSFEITFIWHHVWMQLFCFTVKHISNDVPPLLAGDLEFRNVSPFRIQGDSRCIVYAFVLTPENLIVYRVWKWALERGDGILCDQVKDINVSCTRPLPSWRPPQSFFIKEVNERKEKMSFYVYGNNHINEFAAPKKKKTKFRGFWGWNANAQNVWNLIIYKCDCSQNKIVLRKKTRSS